MEELVEKIKENKDVVKVTEYYGFLEILLEVNDYDISIPAAYMKIYNIFKSPNGKRYAILDIRKEHYEYAKNVINEYGFNIYMSDEQKENLLNRFKSLI